MFALAVNYTARHISLWESRKTKIRRSAPQSEARNAQTDQTCSSARFLTCMSCASVFLDVIFTNALYIIRSNISNRDMMLPPRSRPKYPPKSPENMHSTKISHHHKRWFRGGDGPRARKLCERCPQVVPTGTLLSIFWDRKMSRCFWTLLFNVRC